MLEDKDLKRAAEIARIKLSEAEFIQLKADLNALLDVFKKVQEISEGDELYYIAPARTVLRKDIPEQSTPHSPEELATLIRNKFTKKDEDGFLIAPKNQ